jgi:ADP-ribosylglycohydrolase
MLGAIAGDMIGSVFEFEGLKSTQFPLFDILSTFTDDTVLTVALAESILTGEPYSEMMVSYVERFPGRGYGSHFTRWVNQPQHLPYDSFGNGAAMRISPVAYAWNSLREVEQRAAEFTAVTHSHPEGIKGGQATAAAIFLARKGNTKAQIKDYIETTYGYNLQRSMDEIRPEYSFDESSQGTVPEAISAFLESTSFENAIRLSISLGGDADTLACITGAIAEAFYGGVPEDISREVYQRLDPYLVRITRHFIAKYVKR